jgi:serine/threonine-protein phosphatase PP1 catalytic subunit
MQGQGDHVDFLIDVLLESKTNSNFVELNIPQDLICRVVHEATELMMTQPMLLELRAPMNVVGDVHGIALFMFSLLDPLCIYLSIFLFIYLFLTHTSMIDAGQYPDLLNMFAKCGMPLDSNYLFLGDYVDRARRSIECIMLLLCLKLKFPENIFLLRGNHGALLAFS